MRYSMWRNKNLRQPAAVASVQDTPLMCMHYVRRRTISHADWHWRPDDKMHHCLLAVLWWIDRANADRSSPSLLQPGISIRNQISRKVGGGYGGECWRKEHWSLFMKVGYHQMGYLGPYVWSLFLTRSIYDYSCGKHAFWALFLTWYIHDYSCAIKDDEWLLHMLQEQRSYAIAKCSFSIKRMFYFTRYILAHCLYLQCMDFKFHGKNNILSRKYKFDNS
jgi:hypothetical protein